jgi:hypothetical protein
MPRVEFKPAILASKRVKTVHALDHSATVIGIITVGLYNTKNFE